MPVRIRGVNGSIRWGYQTAATLSAWSIAPIKVAKTFTLTAQAANTDPFKLSQRPLTFSAPVQGQEWRLPILTLEQKDATITATLGPPKES